MTRPAGEAIRRVDREIIAEKAASLGRAGERLEQALAAVAFVAAQMALARDAVDRGRLVEDYRRALCRARDARLALVIQREALGLRRHGVVDERFPEPPARPPGAPTEG